MSTKTFKFVNFFHKDSHVARVNAVKVNVPAKNSGVCRACGFQVEDRTPSNLCEDCLDYWGVEPENDVE